MTRDETKKIIMVISASYPNWKPNDLSFTVDAWHMMLSEYSYNDISLALKTYITTDASGFAPSVGQLVSKMQIILTPFELTEMEAWSLVSKAIRNSTYNHLEEYAKLPPLVQKAVGIPEQLRTWAVDEYYNETVVSSNFMRSYQIVLSRNREISKMPETIKILIDKINETSHVALIDKKREDAIESMHKRKESETKAIEMKPECIPMPVEYKERLMKELEGG